MVEIFSRGSRPQDARLKAFLDQNRSTIVKLADHLTQGQYSAGKAPKAPAREPERNTIFHATSDSPSIVEPRPVVRATLNGRVVVVDDNSGRQVHHLGEIRARGDAIMFLLASAENGFSAPLPDDLLDALIDLDHAELAADGGEEALVGELASRLGIE
jgi:hypothetical protein